METLRTTTSICPECFDHIDAEIVADDSTGQVYMIKNCPKHGEFRDRLSSDIEEYKWQSKFCEEVGSTVNNCTTPDKKGAKTNKGCPFDCGLCTKHVTSPNICLIDITNRCNLRCPICFANAGATGYVVEPSFDEIVQIMKHFRNIRPNPAPLLQLSGGEPTLREDLPDICREAKKLGFIEILLTTNGMRMAKSVDYCRELIEAGVDAIYLSFDGTEPETWKKIRGLDLSKAKMQVIKNVDQILKETKYPQVSIFLVPVIVRGINDHEIGHILDVAKEYAGTIGGVIFQPVSLCGRISQEDILKMRYTTSDLKEAINAHTGGLIKKFYPIATTAKFTRLINWFDNKEEWSMNSHSDCGFATIGIIDKNNNWVPIEDYIDVEGVIPYTNKFYDEMVKTSAFHPIAQLKIKKTQNALIDTWMESVDNIAELSRRMYHRVRFLTGALKFLKPKLTDALQDVDWRNFLMDFFRLFMNPSLDSSGHFLKNKHLMISSMHFQDAYNFDVNRVSHCLVHYGVINPNDPEKVLEIPFCAMNTIHRESIEKQLSEMYKTKTDPIELKEAADQSVREIEEFEGTL